MEIDTEKDKRQFVTTSEEDKAIIPDNLFVLEWESVRQKTNCYMLSSYSSNTGENTNVQWLVKWNTRSKPPSLLNSSIIKGHNKVTQSRDIIKVPTYFPDDPETGQQVVEFKVTMQGLDPGHQQMFHVHDLTFDLTPKPF